MWSIKNASAIAAKTIDVQLTNAAKAVEAVSGNLQGMAVGNDKVMPFAKPAADKLGRLALRIRAQDSEQLVTAWKHQMLAHPKMTIGAAAIAGALIAQAALAAFRSELKTKADVELTQLG